MKNVLKCFIIFIMAIGLCASCNQEEQITYKDLQESYDKGYADGHTIGYGEGMFDKYKEIKDDIQYYMYDVKDDAVDKGWHPEEALVVLEEYAKGKSTKDEYMNALNTLSVYYYGVLDCLSETIDVDAY